MSAKYKPGSRVQQVWEVYEAKGASAAFDFGLTLELKAGTLKSWVAGWARENNNHINDVNMTVVKKRNSAGAIIGKRRVAAVWWPERKGYVVTAGAEQSWVRWDEMPGEFSPAESSINNDQLKDA